MLRIAVQSKGRLFEDTMALFAEADIKLLRPNARCSHNRPTFR